MKRRVEIAILLILLAVFIHQAWPRVAAYYYNRGLALYDQADYDQALTSFERSLKLYPSHNPTRYYIGRCYDKKGMFSQAIAWYKETLKYDPAYIDVYRDLIDIYKKDKQFEKALSLLKKADNIAKSNSAFKDLAKTLSFEYLVDSIYAGVDAFVAENKDKAYTLLERALTINPNFAYTHYMLGFFYYIDRDYNQTKSYLRKAIEIDAGFWPAYKLLGDIYYNHGDFDRAIKNYKTVVSLGRQDAVMSNNLGVALMRQEKYEEALEYLNLAVSLAPENINFRYNLASIYRDHGVLDRAAQEFRRVARREPKYPNVHNDLADIYYQKKNITLAKREYALEVEYAKERLKSAPDDISALRQLAHAYAGIDKHKQAEKIIRDVINRQPNYRDAYLTLAEIYKRTDRFQEALEVLDEAAALSRYKNFIIEDIEIVRELDNIFSPKVKKSDFARVHLKNGRIIEGHVMEEDSNKMVIEVCLGSGCGMLTVQRSDIKRVFR